MTVGDPSLEYNLTVHKDLESSLNYIPKAVFITNPPDLHIETAIKAAQKGCHLFIEKPLSSNLKNIDRLKKIVKENDLICRVGQQFRFHKFTSIIKDYINNKVIGEISSAEFIYKEYLPGMHPYEDYKASHASHTNRGGGVVLSLNHYIDIVCYFFGYPDEIVCFGGTNGNLDISVEDTVTIIFNYEKENGKNNTVTIILDFITRPKQMSWSITAEHGSINVDFIKNTLCFNDYKNDIINKIITQNNVSRNDLFIDEQKEYFDLINNNDTNNKLPDLSESHKNMELLFGIIESMKSKKIITM